MTTQAVKPVTITSLGQAVYPSFAMLAGMELDVFTPLKDGPLSGAAVAAAIGVNPDRLGPLLYALVQAGLLQVEGERFANMPEAEQYLVRGKPTYIGSNHELFTEMWRAALGVSQSIRGDAPHARHDWGTMSDAELVTLLRGLHAGAVTNGRQFAESEKLERFRHLLDVGGGSGGLAIAACQACPDLRATVAELPRVAVIATDFVAGSGVADRVKILAADVNQQPPPGRYDVATFRHFFQVMSRDQARRALVNVGQAIEPGGTIYIVGHVLEDSRLAPETAVGMNLVFLSVYDAGQSYTESEYRAWLEEAGFGEVEVRFGGGPGTVTVIVARKQVGA